MKKWHEGRKHIPHQHSQFFKDKRKKRIKEFKKRIREDERDALLVFFAWLFE